MDKEAALLVVAKDLFLEKWRGTVIKPAAKPKVEEELGVFADTFVTFFKKIRSSLGD